MTGIVARGSIEVRGWESFRCLSFRCVCLMSIGPAVVDVRENQRGRPDESTPIVEVSRETMNPPSPALLLKDVVGTKRSTLDRVYR